MTTHSITVIDRHSDRVQQQGKKKSLTKA